MTILSEFKKIKDQTWDFGELCNSKNSKTGLRIGKHNI